MLAPGVYRIFHITMGGESPVERHVARILIDGSKFHILEDPHSLIDDMSMGEMNSDHTKMLYNLIHSPYYRLINEEHINQGDYGSLIPEMDIGPTQPDEEYILHGEALDEPQKVEIFGGNICVNGEKLSQDQAEDLMNKVHNGFLTLTPV